MQRQHHRQFSVHPLNKWPLTMNIKWIIPVLLSLPSAAMAQNADTTARGGRNIIKYNATGIFFKYHSLQFERVTGRKQSFALSVGYAKDAPLPFKQILIDRFGDDPQAADIIGSTRFDRFTVTPEYRFYLGKKAAPLGFYAAPFLRYSQLKSEQEFTFVDADNSKHTAQFSGTLKGYGGGLLLGAQWALGRHAVIDLWLVGPFYGKQSGTLRGVDDRPVLDPQGWEDDINNTDLGPWKLQATVSNQNINGSQRAVADVTIDGPFFGLRTGINLGIRF